MAEGNVLCIIDDGDSGSNFYRVRWSLVDKERRGRTGDREIRMGTPEILGHEEVLSILD